MINEKSAQRYFPGQNPIGRHLGFGHDPGTRTDMEIIGVVKMSSTRIYAMTSRSRRLFPISGVTGSAA